MKLWKGKNYGSQTQLIQYSKFVLSWSYFCFKSDGQDISTKILISWQGLKNRFLSFFVHK